jgi:hypothetical protein
MAKGHSSSLPSLWPPFLIRDGVWHSGANGINPSLPRYPSIAGRGDIERR